jgi:hypothetical protein
METEKRPFEIKIDALLEKKRLTEEDKAFLRARKDYIAKDIYKSLGLDDKKSKPEKTDDKKSDK